MPKLKFLNCLAPLLLTLSIMRPASAHAFPDRSIPHVGSAVATAPRSVRIWFDGDLEPVFSTLMVKTESGTQVSMGQGRVSTSDRTLLETDLPATLPPGKYYVYWSVIARDGHHTEGRFSFSVK